MVPAAILGAIVMVGLIVFGIMGLMQTRDVAYLKAEIARLDKAQREFVEALEAVATKQRRSST